MFSALTQRESVRFSLHIKTIMSKTNCATTLATPKRKLRKKTKLFLYAAILTLESPVNGSKINGCNDLSRYIMSFLVVLPTGCYGPRKRGNGIVHLHKHNLRPSAYNHLTDYLTENDQTYILQLIEKDYSHR